MSTTTLTANGHHVINHPSGAVIRVCVVAETYLLVDGQRAPKPLPDPEVLFDDYCDAFGQTIGFDYVVDPAHIQWMTERAASSDSYIRLVMSTAAKAPGQPERELQEFTTLWLS